MALKIRKLEKHIGAEVQGVDITSPIDVETFEQLRGALCEYGVLVFHNQDITDEQHVRFSEGFGPLEMTMPNDPIGDGGPIGVISNLNENGDIIPPEDPRTLYTVANTLWHSDGSFKHVPLRGSLLYAKIVPPKGGETEFASLTAAYAALPDQKKVDIENLIVEHSIAHSRAQIAPNLMEEAFQKDTPPVNQRLVRPIPETGKKALLVGSYTTHVHGLPIEAGKALLKELLEWSTQPQFVYRHTWKVSDLVVYDNRCCLHRGRSWDRGKYKRVLHRTTLAGDGPTVE